MQFEQFMSVQLSFGETKTVKNKTMNSMMFCFVMMFKSVDKYYIFFSLSDLSSRNFRNL